MKAASRSSGTLTTISGSTSFAIDTTGCPSATTWPTSNFTPVTTPSCDARSVVYSRRLRASSSLRASASATARVVCALLCAFSSSEGLTEPSPFERIQALAIGLRLARLRFGGDQLLLRRLDGELVVGVVEHGDDVALANLLAHVDLADDDLAADAEGLVDLVARLHGAEIAVLFLRLVVADLHRAHGAQPLGRRLLRAAGQDRGDRCGEQCRGTGGFHDGSSGWFHDFGVGVVAAEAGCVAGSKACHPPPSAL